MEKIKAVVFDLDGTLVDSLLDIARAVNQVLENHSRQPHGLDFYRREVGWGLKRLLNAAASPSFEAGEDEKAYEEVLEDYRAHPVVKSVLYPGINELLSTLQGRIPLAVLSNKEDSVTQQVVRILLPGKGLDPIQGARANIPSKPDPHALREIVETWKIEASQVLFVGDTGVDMKTALNAGAIPCGAGWGFRQSELQEGGARWIFDSPEELRDWILSSGFFSGFVIKGRGGSS